MTTAKISLSRGQAEFFASQAHYRGLSAGYAFGKSHLMGLCTSTDMMHSSSVIVGVYEPFHDLVRTVAWPNVQKWLVELGIRFTLNKQESVIYTSNSGVGDCYFKSMDNIDALVGYETYTSHIDEIDTMSADNAEKAFFKIMGRNRQNIQDVPTEYKKWNEKAQRFDCINRISVYSTPEGFKFFYKMWHPDNENAKKNPEFKLFYGRTLDNPYLSDDYIDGLKSTYPKEMLDAYMEGKFVNLESGTVYYNFDRKRHRTNRTIQQNDILHIGIDFNVGNTSAVIFVDDADDIRAVAEITKQLDTPALIKEIKRRWPTHKIFAYPDASARNRHTSNASVSDIAELDQAGFIVRAHSKNPRIKDRVASVIKVLEKDRFLVNVNECPNLTNYLEQQAYDKNNEPDKSTGIDHLLDAMGYRIHYSFPIKKPIFSIDYSFAERR
jgi:Terminase-like family.